MRAGTAYSTGVTATRAESHVSSTHLLQLHQPPNPATLDKAIEAAIANHNSLLNAFCTYMHQFAPQQH
jgi:hypothetical protein